MVVGLFFNILILVHALTSIAGCGLATVEVWQQHPKPFFAQKGDTVYQAAARGFIAGMYFPYMVIKEARVIWSNTH